MIFHCEKSVLKFRSGLSSFIKSHKSLNRIACAIFNLIVSENKMMTFDFISTLILINASLNYVL